MAYTKYSLTPSNNNAAPPDGAPEGMLPSAVNDTMRDMMAQIRDCGDGIRGGTYTMTAPVITGGSISGTTFASGAATITGGSINGTTVGASTASTGAFTSLSASGAFSANGGATLGDASGDALTINSSAVSIPNGLNFDSNTFVIDATNNRVGVGTASPVTILQTDGVSGATVNDVQTILVRDTTSYAAGIGGGISFGYKYNSSAGYINRAATIKAVKENATDGNYATSLVFGTTANSASTTEKMRLDSAGNLGLGVTPSAWVSTAKVLVLGSTQSGTIAALSGGSFSMENNSYTNTSGVGTYIATGYATRYYQSSGGAHVWNTAPSGTAGNAITFTQAMTLNASGNLSIGTTAAIGKLTVGGTNTNDTTANSISVTRFTDGRGGAVMSSYLTSFGTDTLMLSASTASAVDLTKVKYLTTANGEHVWYGSTTSTERMRIDSSGNVGLGITPSAWTGNTFKALEIGYAGNSFAGQSGASQVSISSNCTYISGNWTYANSSVAASQYYQSAGSHKWQVAPSGTAGTAITFTQAMTLNASGYLGIGATAPTRPLTVYAAAGDVYALWATADTGATTSDGLQIGVQAGTNDALINNKESSNLRMFTANTERMRIDSSGNVGIGTSSPASYGKLAITGNLSSTTSGTYFLDGTNAGSAANPTYSFYIDQNTGMYRPQADTVGLVTGGTERMRIDSSGNLLVGTTSALSGTSNTNSGMSFVPGAASQLYVSNNATDNMVCQSIVASGTANKIAFIYNSTVVGRISSTSSATTYATSSDYRLKENIAPMTGALDVVQQLKPVIYNWKIDGSSGQGFIAHELQAVVPECVTGEKDAVDEEGKPVYQGIDTSFLVATLTKAIQELKAELDVVKAELNTLKGK